MPITINRMKQSVLFAGTQAPCRRVTAACVYILQHSQDIHGFDLRAHLLAERGVGKIAQPFFDLHNRGCRLALALSLGNKCESDWLEGVAGILASGSGVRRLRPGARLWSEIGPYSRVWRPSVDEPDNCVSAGVLWPASHIAVPPLFQQNIFPGFGGRKSIRRP